MSLSSSFSVGVEHENKTKTRTRTVWFDPALVPLVVARFPTYGLEASVWPRIDRPQKRLQWVLDRSAPPQTRGVVQETIVAHYSILYVMTAKLFFLTSLFTATFCILSTAAPYPEEKSMEKTTLYFLLFRKRVPSYLIDRQPSQHPLNLPIRSLSDLNCLTINSTHAKCSKTSVWFIAPSCLPWRVNLSAILSQSRPCPYLPAW